MPYNVPPGPGMRQDSRKMRRDQANARLQGPQVTDPRKAAQANAPAAQKPAAPLSPATRGTRPAVPTFQAGQQAPIPPPPPPAPPPQPMAPAAPPGGPGGGVQTPGNFSGRTPGSTGTTSQSGLQQGGGRIPTSPMSHGTQTPTEWDDLFVNDPGPGPGGTTIDPGVLTDSETDPGAGAGDIPPPVENDPWNMLDDYLASLDAGTAEDEALLQEQIDRQIGSQVADNRARLGRAGFGVSGALSGLENDARSQGALDFGMGAADLREKAEQQKIDAIMDAIGAGQEQQGLDIEQSAYDQANKILDEILGDGEGDEEGGVGGGGFGGDIEEGYNEGGLGGALEGATGEAVNAAMTAAYGQPYEGSSWTTAQPPPDAEIVESEPHPNGGFMTTWRDADGNLYTNITQHDNSPY